MFVLLRSLLVKLIMFVRSVVRSLLPAKKSYPINLVPKDLGTLKAFDQTKTLRPPPFPSSWKWHRIAKAYVINDPGVEGVSPVLLHKGQGFEVLPEPAWMDAAAVVRGQKVFMNNLFASFTGLMGSLLQGYGIGRFADVLVLSHYADSPRQTYDRYDHTGTHIYQWMSGDLLDPASPARQSINQVRGFHQLARMRTSEVFAKENAGVPLSQFDLSLVLIAFGPLTLLSMKEDFGVSLTMQQQDDYIHAWRYVGYHLGIMDEYNSCVDLEASEDLTKEFLLLSDVLRDSVRPSTNLLQTSTITGFGRHVGLGFRMVESLIYVIRPWLGLHRVAFLPDRNEAAISLMKTIFNRPSFHHKILNVVLERFLWVSLHYPRYQHYVVTYVSPMRGLFMDTVLGLVEPLWKDVVRRGGEKGTRPLH